MTEVPEMQSKMVGTTWNGYQVWASTSMSLVRDGVWWPQVTVHKPPNANNQYDIFLSISFDMSNSYPTAEEALAVAERVASFMLGVGWGRDLDDLLEIKLTGRIKGNEDYDC